MSEGQDPDLIECLYRAARDPQRWREALSQLAVHTGAASAMIATYDPAGGLSSVVASTGSAPGNVDRIAEQILRHCPSRGFAGRGDAGAPPIVFVAPTRLADGEPCHLALPHPALCTAGRVGWIAIALKPGQAARREQAGHRFSSLRGHLVSALDIALDLADARHGTSSTITLLSAMPTAALLLEAGAGIIQANVAARVILTQGDAVIETPERRLRATLAREDQRLAKAIEVSLAASRDERTDRGRQVIRIRQAANADQLLVILDPVPLSGHRSFLDQPREAVLVRMIGDEHTPASMTYPLEAAFDLTPAETRIAAAIASGRSTATAAHHLDLSTNTVRTHLARIFDKTGTRSQHALTRLLAAIGSWPLP